MCTYTNKRQPLLTLVKSVVNDNGGTAVAGAWTLGATGSSGSFSGTANTAAVTSKTVTAGVQYTLAESGGPSTYSASSWVCTGGGSFAGPDKITLGLGEDVTCTITNNDQGPSLTLVKQVVNDNGGSAVASNFTLTASGPTSISGPGGVSSGASFSAGTYALSETAVPGYTAGSWSCTGTGTQNGASITLGLAQSATCTITNNDQPATLIVKKVVVNDNGGTKQAQNFSFQVNGGSAQPFQADGQNDLTVNAGTYNVVEPAVAGYATTYDNCSGVVIAPGGTATCTVTNNDIPATLIVKKVVVNDDGGTADRGRLLVPGERWLGDRVRGRRPERSVGRRRHLQRRRAGRRRVHDDLPGVLEHRDPARRDRDVHGHEQRPAGDADRQEGRRERRRRHRHRGRLLVPGERWLGDRRSRPTGRTTCRWTRGRTRWSNRRSPGTRRATRTARRS